MNEASLVSAEQVAEFGKSLEQRIISELGATPSEGFPELREVHNLAGENTGYVNVYNAD